MNPALNFFFWSALSNTALSLLLGGLVWIRDPKKPLHITYALFSLAVASWGAHDALWLSSSDPSRAIRHFQWLMASSAFIPVFYVHHLCCLLGCVSRRKKVIVAGYVLACLSACSTFSRLFMGNFHLKPPFPLWPDGHLLYLFYLAFFFAYVIYGLWLIFHNYRTSAGHLRKQLQYVFAASLIGWVGGMTSFPLFYDYHILPYGHIAISLYAIITAYAIYKHRLLDIKIIIQKTVLYSLVSAALACVYGAIISLAAHFMEGGHVSASALPSMLAVVFIAFLFNPLRNKLQVFIDKKFARERVNLEEKISEFSASILNERNAMKVTQALFKVLEQGFRPKQLAFYERVGVGKGFGKSASLSLAWPEIEDGSNVILGLSREASPDFPHMLTPESLDGEVRLWQVGGRVLVPLQSRGEWLGALLLGEKKSEEAYGNEDLVLLRIIANQAALAYERPKLVREVSGGFVHEVKTPLAKISLSSELTLLDIGKARHGEGVTDELLDKVQKRMEFILGQVALAAQRVDALRELGSSRENRRGLQNLELIATKSLASAEDLLLRHRVKAKHVWPADLAAVRADSEQLEILFTNLFKNAVEAMSGLPPEKERQITLRGRQEEGHVVIEVEDTGPGIPPEDRERIFQPHYTTKGANGAGMGLFLCRQIVQAHGGTIEVVNAETSGAAFQISIPGSE